MGGIGISIEGEILNIKKTLYTSHIKHEDTRSSTRDVQIIRLYMSKKKSTVWILFGFHSPIINLKFPNRPHCHVTVTFINPILMCI